MVACREMAFHSDPIVPGGLLVTSYTTRLIPRTSLVMRVEIRASTSGGKGNQSVFMPSVEVTAQRDGLVVGVGGANYADFVRSLLFKSLLGAASFGCEKWLSTASVLKRAA